MKNKSCFLRVLTINTMLLSMLLVLSPAPAADNNTVAITGGNIVTVSGEVIKEGTILVKDGIISELGTGIEVPAGAEVIEASGKWVVPGLIQSATDIGTGEGYSDRNSDETSSPNTAQMFITDALNPFDKDIEKATISGVTSAMISPGRSNVIGGQAAVIKMRGKTVEEMVVKNPAGIKFSLGEGPKDTYGAKKQLPTTRMGEAYVVRKALVEAGEYLAKQKAYEKKKASGEEAESPSRDLAKEPLAALLDGRMTAFFECYRVDDIMTAIRLSDEFKLKTVLVGCSEGYKLAEEIASRNIPVIVGSFGIGPRRMETQHLSLENAGILAAAGVKVAIKSDEVYGVGSLSELPLTAALAAKGGLDMDTALRAITLTPAEIFGVEDRIGSLEKGKDADIAIFSGEPLHYRSIVERVLIDGKTVFKSTPE